ncbi:putative hexosyltransferase [Helianthus annuus]|uniref:Hexosyltransferase n=1 Tax=Helianthus annuus TaxID=4232 RepID=A0A251SSH1_HELAN|nr:glucosamine inositolphosphorylceramide transferase 1 [Helianthus annuus]KAF5765586.1 putative hexosyltransferase [Helianthus annuus]KAJ0473995.1 putative hexosyltransferase [Helianthus annuus]KAJ0832292.1 putative hexosyltransferase [Helianthus annuus]
MVSRFSATTVKTHRLRLDNGGMSSTVSFLFVSFMLFSSIGYLYTCIVYKNINVNNYGCEEDGEGWWAIGVFYGDSPFSLKPIEDMNVWENMSSSWPVANPVVTCGSVSESGFPSNFVADPFLYVQGDVLYMFFETKNPITMQGDIGAARSIDNGASWQQLGVVLDEEWHLSYPFVFDYDGQIYMMPEGSKKGDLRLYRAVEFPLKWELEKIILKRPLIDSFIMEYESRYWLFGSDHSRTGSKKNGELEIWYSNTPFGPWKQHKNNPIYNTGEKMGARNGGRPVFYNGNVYRFGQDDGETYGKRVRVFKIEVLTPYSYKEVEVDLGIEKATKGKNAWNGARSHHLDVQQLKSGQWIAVSDGDRTPSGDVTRRYVVGWLLILATGSLVFVMGVLLGFVRCIVPLSWCPHSVKKRSDSFLVLERSSVLSSKLRGCCTRLNRVSLFIRCKMNPNTSFGRLAFLAILVVCIVLLCVGIGYIYGGSGGHEPYAIDNRYSQFTMLAMTYDARLWNLKWYIKHYSRCPSVREIVVVWNKGTLPDLTEFDSAVPLRVRVEEKNSLNNRFKIDPMIKTRAVLELDDDIIMSCEHIERGFKVWRENPDRLVGFYPRLVSGPGPLEYRGEKHARKFNGYNMILTGAAFMDNRVAFGRYWSEEAKAGREVVDAVFNCEDVLMNFLYANATSSRTTVEYVKPTWAIDTSKLSRVAISENTQAHYRVRSYCLEKFTALYGGISDEKVEFRRRRDGWDL